jgi:DNA-directed RNA polymerase subunit RPC12/RpoP
MNFTLRYHCPMCFKEFGNTKNDEILAQLHCAPQATPVYRCGKCGKPAKTLHLALKCCTPRDEVVTIIKEKDGTRKVEVPCIDLL